MAVRAHQRDAVDVAQAVADRADTRARRRPPGVARGRRVRRRSRARAHGIAQRGGAYILARCARSSDHSGEIGGVPVFWRSGARRRRRRGRRARLSTCTACRRTRTTGSSSSRAAAGIAPDLPGFGRSGKPGSLRYSIDEYAGFIEASSTASAIERVSLVVHDWGAVGLAFAQRHPERIDRLVVINAVPLLPGYRWHRTARIWRTPVLGELSMGTHEPAPAAAALARGATRRRGRCRRRGSTRCSTTSTRARSARSCACTAARRPTCSRLPERAWATSAPGARRVGHARPVHPGALRAGVRRRARRRRAAGARGRGALAVARPAGRDRPGRRVPRRAA